MLAFETRLLRPPPVKPVARAMNKHLFSIALLAGFLAACGGDERSPAPTPVSHSAPAATPAPEAPAPQQAPTGADAAQRIAVASIQAQTAPGSPPATTTTITGPALLATPALVARPDAKPVDIAQGPAQNPMKGWNATWGDVQEHSSVSHRYISWRQFEPKDGVFITKAALEKELGLEKEDRHLVLRVYLQWFGNADDGPKQKLPDWVVNTQPAWIRTGKHGGSRSEVDRWVLDYNNPEVIKRMHSIVAEIARQWDNDPRVYAIQLGLLGYFGEWHNFNYFEKDALGTLKPYELSTSTHEEVWLAFGTHFKNKALMGRYADQFVDRSVCDPSKPAKACAPARLGHHNDSFSFTKSPNNKSDAAVQRVSLQLRAPLGGEPKPENKGEDLYRNFEGSKALMRELGYSTMSDGHYEPTKAAVALNVTPDNAQKLKEMRDIYLEMHRFFGYNFQISEITIPAFSHSGAVVPINVKAKNVGVAPFYYPWTVELALLDEGNRVVASALVDYDIRQLVPSEKEQAFGTTLIVPSGRKVGEKLTAAVRVSQPGAAAGKPSATPAAGCSADSSTAAGGPFESWGKLAARNTYIQFLNTLEVVQATWSAPPGVGRCLGHALEGGWTKLGSFTLREPLPQGLQAHYRNGLGSNGMADFSRRDAQVQFDWGAASPGGQVGSDHFEVRWEGYVRADADGVHSFEVDANDGVRLSVGDQQLVSRWVAGWGKSIADVTLKKGHLYPIRMEVFEQRGVSWARLNWKTPGSTVYVPVPAGNLSGP